MYMKIIWNRIIKINRYKKLKKIYKRNMKDYEENVREQKNVKGCNGKCVKMYENV